MAAIVKRYAYDLDQTGRHPANLIRNERHTITPQNRTPQNVLIPGYAPFFRESLIVTDMLTGLPLRENVDYTVEWPINVSERIENYRSLYLGIQFINPEITGQFELQYQTLGGQWAINGVEIAQGLANAANDPLTTTYEEILGRPIKLTPIEHVHSIKDFIGFDDVVQAIISLKVAIELLAQEDRDNHPGYDTLIESYFRLERDLANAQEEDRIKFEEMKAKLEKEVADRIKDSNDKRTELINLININKEKIRETENLLRETLRTELAALKETIDNDVMTKLAALRRDVDRVEANANQKILDLGTRLTNEKADLEGKINKLRTDTNNSIQQTKTELNNTIKGVGDRVTALKNFIDTTLTNRIAAAERNITGLQNAHNLLTNSASNGRVDILERDVATLKTQVGNINNQIATINNKLGNINNLQTTIEGINNRLNSMQAAIDDLRRKVQLNTEFRESIRFEY